LNFWILLLLGVLFSMLLAALTGLIILRSSGPYFFMLTLAFGQLVFAVAWKWRSLTGGDDGLPGISRPQIGFNIMTGESRAFYYIVLFIFLTGFLLLWKLIASPLGRSMKGVRESETRMQALGYNIWLIKYAAYVLAAGFAAAAGVLNAFFNGFVSPQELNWTLSGMIMLMVIIGGTGTLAGPAIGAAIIVILQNWSSSYTDRWPLLTGSIFVLCVMFARNGVAGKLQELWRKGVKFLEGSGSKKCK
jgi:branched-chain amino acid transport system permease protein